MAIYTGTTKGSNKWPKILVYGKSGVGKTGLIRTAPNPVIITSENKLTRLNKENFPTIHVQTIEDFEESLNMAVEDTKYKDNKTICIDSISDIAETAVLKELPNHKDDRKAYGVIQNQMFALLKQIRDSRDKRYWYIIAKQKMFANDEGYDQYMPFMPGQQLTPQLPFIFDFIFAMRMFETEDGEAQSFLQTRVGYDIKYEAKDSSGNLKSVEKPNLKMIFKKISK